MAWHLTVTNNYHETIVALGIVIPGPDTRPHKLDARLGHGRISIAGLGDINFTDVGNQDIGGFSKKTWGVLISYQGEELVFRYEGEGQIEVNLNKLGQAEMSGNGDFSRIMLHSFVVS